ncbi:MAG TPA: hypothetical protein VGO77_27440 [Mycobacterium sp.]|nr:hypothetical protein [Mycobacterium sp.]
MSVLLLDVADADGQRESATTQVVDGRSLFRDKEWIALGEDQNPGPKLNAVGPGGEIAECGEVLQDVAEWFGDACG